MFQLKICSFDELPTIRAEFNPTHVISLINTIDPLPGKHLHINMADITAMMTGSHVMPTMDHLLQILEFTKDLTDDDRLVVHCLAGQSRSTAVAIGILIQHGMDYGEAFNYVSTIRPILLPNRLIIRYIDQHFHLHTDLEKLVKEYYQGMVIRQQKPSGAPSENDIEWMKNLNRAMRRLERDGENNPDA